MAWLDEKLEAGIHWPTKRRREFVERFVARALKDLDEGEICDVFVELEDIQLKWSVLFVLLQDAYALWESTLFRSYEARCARYPKLHEVFDPLPALNDRFGEEFIHSLILEWYGCHQHWAQTDKKYLYTLLRYDPSWLEVPGAARLITQDVFKQSVPWQHFSRRRKPQLGAPKSTKTGSPSSPAVREKRELFTLRLASLRANGETAMFAYDEINDELAYHGIARIQKTDDKANILVSRDQLDDWIALLKRFQSSKFCVALESSP